MNLRALLACLSAFSVGAASVSAGTIFVDDSAAGGNNGTSWANAFARLQDGLAAAVPGDQVWVAEGTYYPDQGAAVVAGDRSATFNLATGVELYGAFFGNESSVAARAGSVKATVLSGDLNHDDAVLGNAENSIHVVTGSFVNATAIVDSFTITAGNADSATSGNDAGGMHLTGAAPIIRDCRFVGNSSVDDGGAVDSLSSSDPTFIGCVFQGNVCGDVGGAIWSSSSHLTLLNCAFLGNDSGRLGGALYYFGPSNGISEVAGCVFSGNIAADKGGAVYVSSTNSSPRFTGCTFSANHAVVGAGGIFATSTTQISTSVLWGNADPSGTQEKSQIAGTPGVHHSCVEGLTGALGGVGNTGSDPKFLDQHGADLVAGTEDDDLRLGSGSSGIDAGDSAALPADGHDLDGDGNTAEPLPLDIAGGPRFTDDPNVADVGVGPYPIADMGAYEGSFSSGVLSYGQGCPGTGGIVPTLDMIGVPVAGGVVTLVIANGLPNSTSVLLFGLTQSQLQVGGGCSLNITPVLPLMLTIPLGPAGSTSIPGAIPAGTAGLVFTMQVFVDEPALLKPFSNSKGLQLTVQ